MMVSRLVDPTQGRMTGETATGRQWSIGQLATVSGVTALERHRHSTPAACPAVHDRARNWNELGSVLHRWEHTELNANLPQTTAGRGAGGARSTRTRSAG